MNTRATVIAIAHQGGMFQVICRESFTDVCTLLWNLEGPVPGRGVELTTLEGGRQWVPDSSVGHVIAVWEATLQTGDGRIAVPQLVVGDQPPQRH